MQRLTRNLHSHLWIAIGICFVGWTGCRAKAPASSGEDRAAEKAIAQEQIQVDAQPEAPFELLEASIAGDSLVVLVQYGGGCGEHAFSLRQKGPMMKSLPPKQMLEVVHRTEGDPCRALIRERHAFDLTRFRGTPRGVTVILLENWNEPLNYAYD